jgi:hypothetical protein
MKYRKLRIAWSVGWGVLCLLLVAVWLRSYRVAEGIEGRPIGRSGSSFSIRYDNGFIGVTGYPDLFAFRNSRRFIVTRHGSSREPYSHLLPKYGRIANGDASFYVPCWMAMLGIATVGALPWMPWHFGLRTLLIAMTLVAVGLGLSVWVVR